jgi:hypothetical protein
MKSVHNGFFFKNKIKKLSGPDPVNIKATDATCPTLGHLVCVVEKHLTHLVDRDCGVDGAGQTHLTHQVRQRP